MTIDILCRVVDNLGDIGFVYRLARCLSELPDPPRIRLIVDDLASFSGICPGVKINQPLQSLDGWTIVSWQSPGESAIKLFRAERPRFVLECYACGRPDWFESILFDPSDTAHRYVVNLEYLTAESWACDFHKLPSLTRSPLVHKSIFMPGFAAGTGGLLQDALFCEYVEKCSTPDGLYAVRHAVLEALKSDDSFDLRASTAHFSPESAFWFFAFSYEHDFSSIIDELAAFNAHTPVLAIVAAGRSAAPFLDAWSFAGCPFSVLTLPLLPQKRWDAFIAASDFAIVRGEETFSRAVLSRHPFLWHCYPFALSEADGNGGQLPKVYAFLSLLRPLLTSSDYAAYERLTLDFNGAVSDTSSGDLHAILQAGKSDSPLVRGFGDLSQNARNLGNLASNLMTFLSDLR
jgi:uncharacterized repeat protein (TIGR03837 family)